MRTQEGLLDVLAIGCVLEFTTALSRDRYAVSYDATTDEFYADQTRENQARTWFRVLMKVFGKHHAIVMEDKVVHPTYLWHSVIVGFAAAIINYMKAKENDAKFAPGVNPASVHEAIYHHLKEDHPHLVGALDVALLNKTPRSELTWKGPDFQVVPKSRSFNTLMRAMGISEQRDVDTWPLYPTIRSHPAYDGRGVEEALNRYFGGVWPGEDLPHDQVHNAF